MTTTPQAAQLLASRAWRLRHSAWLLAPLLTCGLLGGFGFVYVWARTRTRTFARGAVVGVASSTALWFLSSFEDGAGQITDVAMGLILLVLAGQLGYGFVLNRQYLRWRAAEAAHGPWYVQPQPAPPPAPVVSVPPPPSTSPDAVADLRHRLDLLAGQVRTGPALPDDVRSALDRLLDGLRGVLARGQALSTNPDHLYIVDRVIRDYLPTSLNAYVALPASYARTARRPGARSPHDELLHQLGLLEGQLGEIADATYAGDAARLEAQGRFLEDRFRRSELDLP